MTVDCLILAAGEGRRLRPLTDTTPKPMLPVANRPLLEHNVVLARKFGLTTIGINRHHAPAAMTAYFGDGGEWDVDIVWRDEPELTGPAGALTAFADDLGDDPVVVIAGDALHEICLSDLLTAHRNAGAALTLALAEVSDAGQFGVVALDERDRVVGFEEKPARLRGRPGSVSCGVYCVQPEVVATIPRGRVFDWKDVVPGLLAAGRTVLGWRYGGYWLDIGSPPAYLGANLDAAAGRVRCLASDTANADGVLVGRDVGLGADTRVIGPCVIGDGVEIGAGAVVARSVLLPGARIPRAAVVTDAIVATRQGVSR
ncbi:sugar phosphate nucleotidyltransferase [Nocardia takedensis]